jgi:preprotein translocase SecE subunit
VNEQKKAASGRGAQPTASRPAQSQAANGDFVRSVFTELRRVTWPTQNEWVAATVLTLGLVVVLGLLTWGLDLGFGWIFDQLHVNNI